MLIRGARVWPSAISTRTDGPLTDVRISGGRVAECAPGLRPAPGEPDINAAGCALLAGLHDHHVHLRALAAARDSVPVGPPQVRTGPDLARQLAAADAASPPGAWLRCVGYHESVADLLDRRALDRLVQHRPVRVQHRTGALWVVNSAAAAALRLDECELPGVERDAAGRPTGRLWRMDRWLAGRVPAAAPSLPAASLAAVSAEAASLGVTGFTDATPGATPDDLGSLARAVADGTVVQRLHCMAPADACPAAPAGITIGPVKIMLDDDRLPPLDELADRMRRAHAAGQPVAVHCVTRVQLVLTLAALDDAGRLPGDRIEHGAVIPTECLPALAGLTVVTQPHFVAERGDQYAAEVSPEDLPGLWRLRSLTDAGVAIAVGSDAPFGGADPWHVMLAAARRPPSFQTDEAVSPAAALCLFLGEPDAPATARRVTPGAPADLVLLRVPPAEALRSLASDLVAATFVAGRQVYAREHLDQAPTVRDGGRSPRITATMSSAWHVAGTSWARKIRAYRATILPAGFSAGPRC
jgi:predicted amidohydrolase YtcJ